MDINSLSNYEKAQIENFLNKSKIIDAILSKDWDEIFIQHSLSLLNTSIRQILQDAGLVTPQEILESLPYIPSFLFHRDLEITQIDIPANIKSIDYQAFNQCAKLTSVTIRQGVRSISSTAFGNCSDLEEIIFQNTPLKAIGLGAFAHANKLKNIELPNTLENIESRAFIDTGITELRLPSSLISLDSQAFENMQFLREITIPDKIIRLPFRAFMNCRQLENITLPRSLDVIDHRVFENCISLSKIIYEGSKEEWESIYKYPDWNTGMNKYAEIIYLNK